MFWRRMGDVALDFCKARSKIFLFVLCKNLRSPFKNNALCCFFTAFESPNVLLHKTKKHSLARMLYCFGGGWGIRTLVPVKANGFQEVYQRIPFQLSSVQFLLKRFAKILILQGFLGLFGTVLNQNELIGIDTNPSFFE